MSDNEALLREIREIHRTLKSALFSGLLDELKSINEKLTPPQLKPGYKVELGRVFANGATIPDDVDLVMGAGGLRWIRVGADQWRPRDVEAPAVSANEMLSLTGHVTEIPAPGGVIEP